MNNEKPIAVYSMTNSFGIEIMSMDDFKVRWRWSNDRKVRTSVIQEKLDKDTGRPAFRFRANRCWIRLDECMRI